MLFFIFNVETNSVAKPQNSNYIENKSLNFLKHFWIDLNIDVSKF